MSIQTVAPLKKAGIKIKVTPKFGGKALGVPYIKQTQTLWCWAACAEMVIRFYSSVVEQCQLANWLFQRNECCQSPSSNGCNQGCSFDDVARVYTNWGVTCNPTTNQVPFATFISEIDANRPVEIGFIWNQGGGHVIIIRGYDQGAGGNIALVNDPWYGTGGVKYENLQTAYGQGRWFGSWTNLHK